VWLVAPAETTLDAQHGGQIGTSDGILVVQVPAGQVLATTLDVAPAPITPNMPLPIGRLRLTEATFDVTARAWDGTFVAQPLQIQVRPTAAMVNSVVGDLSRLVVARLDPVLGWQALPTIVQWDGALSSALPTPGTVAIVRLADTSWIQTLGDATTVGDGAAAVPAGTRLEMLDETPELFHVRTADGTLAWLPRGVAGPVPAPDAAPPQPTVLLADPAPGPAPAT
jgi:hypothetical protein